MAPLKKTKKNQESTLFSSVFNQSPINETGDLIQINDQQEKKTIEAFFATSESGVMLRTPKV